MSNCLPLVTLISPLKTTLPRALFQTHLRMDDFPTNCFTPPAPHSSLWTAFLWILFICPCKEYKPGGGLRTEPLYPPTSTLGVKYRLLLKTRMK